MRHLRELFINYSNDLHILFKNILKQNTTRLFVFSLSFLRAILNAKKIYVYVLVPARFILMISVSR